MSYVVLAIIDYNQIIMEFAIKTKIIAHRGDTKNHPENTLSAFKAALANGADAIELDVHMTSDGELVVHHDYYLGNPDNGEGKIYEKDLSYIKGLAIGATDTIPTLQEVFECIGDKLQYEIELKGVGEEFLRKVADTVKEYNLVNSVEFTSPHSYNLTYIKTLEPAFKTGLFIAPLPDWMDKSLGRKIAIDNALLGNIAVLHCPLSLIDKDFIDTAHSSGILIHVADCNSSEDVKAALKMNVDQLSTNELSLALRTSATDNLVL